jgi:hypothetical protein
MTRELLPQRRPSETFTFEHAGFEYRVAIGFYPAGRIGEVLLSTAKSGTALDITTRDSAILLSCALQQEATVERIRSAMTRDGNRQARGSDGSAARPDGAGRRSRWAGTNPRAEFRWPPGCYGPTFRNSSLGGLNWAAISTEFIVMAI